MWSTINIKLVLVSVHEWHISDLAYPRTQLLETIYNLGCVIPHSKDFMISL
jgi:hypothetical protein